MNEEPHNPSIEPELEARIVALVLGEASDFESDELNRLIALRPELASFKLRMQKVHGLLRDVAASKFVPQGEDWKLSADRRNAVLAVIRGEATVQEVAQSVQMRLPVKRRLQRTLTEVAAVVCIAGAMAFYSFQSQERSASEYFYEAAKTDVPHDEVTALGGTSLSLARKPGSAGADVELYVRSGSGQLDHKNNSVSALSAIQDTLGGYATLPSPDYLKDDVQYFPGGPEFKLPDAVVEHEISALESQGRAAATIENGPLTTPQPADASDYIAKNDTTWMYKGLRDDDRNGSAQLITERMAPNASDGELLFPKPADSLGEVGYPATAAAPAPPLLDVPDRWKVLVDAIEAPSVSDVAPSAGESKTLLPGIITGNEEVRVSGLPQGTGGANWTLDLASVAQTGEESKESLLGERDLRSQTSSPEQRQAQESLRERADANREFSKRRMAAPDPENSIDGEDFANEAKLNESTDIAGTTAPDSGAEVKSLGSLFDRSGRGLGRYADDTAAGYSGVGGGGGFGLNLPSDELGKEMPADAKGFAEGKMDGIANFDDSGLENSSRSKVPARSSMEKMKAAVDWSDQQGLEVLHEAITLADPTDEPVALSAAAKKEGQSNIAGKNAESFGKDGKGIDMPSSGDNLFEDPIEAVFDSNVQDANGKPVDTPAFGSRQLTLPGAKNGDGGEIQDNRKSDSIRTPAAVKRGLSSTDTAQPELSPIIDGFNSHGKNVARIQSKQKEQQVELQKESEVRGEVHSFFRKFGYVPPTLDDDSKTAKKLTAPKVAAPAGLNEKTAAEEAFSTFSLHVSDVSFKLAQAALSRGEWPEAAKIRIEEFVNAFDYGDPLPSKGDRVACRIEQSIHPFVQQRNMLRVSMRTAAEGRAISTPLRLTFLLDNSGSMERIDRQQTVRRAFAMLAQQLTPIDQVTLISFTRQPRLLADKVSGADAGQLVRFIDELPSEGGTNIEAALELAFEKAREQQTPDAQNRIILLTDGAVNLGDADPESLSQMVSAMRGAGIAFDAAGISAEGLNDEVLEALTRKGDGRYYLLDSLESADDGFARQIAGALRPSAKNVKVQIEFNPKRVGHYKLLGFDKHILNKEDFRNDKVDAAEMAAAEAGVAMYQFEAKPDGEGDVGSVSVRFQDLSTGQMIENRWPIPYEADAPRPDQAAPSLRIATSAALLAAKLRGEPLGETVDLQTLSQLVSGLPEQERNDNRVQQLRQMIEQARQLSGK